MALGVLAALVGIACADGHLGGGKAVLHEVVGALVDEAGESCTRFDEGFRLLGKARLGDGRRQLARRFLLDLVLVAARYALHSFELVLNRGVRRECAARRLHEQDLVALDELRRGAASGDADVQAADVLRCRAELEHGRRRTCRHLVGVEVEVLHACEVVHFGRLVDGERVARAVCIRAAVDRARDACALEVDRVVLRHCAESAVDVGGARACAEVHGVARGLAVCGVAAVERARERARRVVDGVVQAVVLLVGGGFCACAARPAAVDVRIGLARIIERERVVLRRVARLGASRPGICAVSCRFRRAPEGVSFVGDGGDFAARLADVDVRLHRGVGVQLGSRGVARAAADVDAVRIFQKRQRLFACTGILHGQRFPVDVSCARRAQQRCVCRCARCVEVHLLETRDAARTVHALDVERVARAVCGRAALEDACDICAAVQVDRVVVRRRAFAARDGADRSVGEVDGVARGFARSLAADDVGG